MVAHATHTHTHTGWIWVTRHDGADHEFRRRFILRAYCGAQSCWSTSGCCCCLDCHALHSHECESALIGYTVLHYCYALKWPVRACRPTWAVAWMKCCQFDCGTLTIDSIFHINNMHLCINKWANMAKWVFIIMLFLSRSLSLSFCLSLSASFYFSQFIRHWLQTVLRTFSMRIKRRPVPRNVDGGFHGCIAASLRWRALVGG